MLLYLHWIAICLLPQQGVGSIELICLSPDLLLKFFVDCVQFSETFIELVCAMIWKTLHNTVCILCKMKYRKSVSKSFPKKNPGRCMEGHEKGQSDWGISQSRSVPTTRLVKESCHRWCSHISIHGQNTVCLKTFCAERLSCKWHVQVVFMEVCLVRDYNKTAVSLTVEFPQILHQGSHILL